MTSYGKLREAAERRGFDFGVAIDADKLRTGSGYRRRVRDEFTAFTPENALKMGPLRPSAGTYDFRDAAVNFGRTNAVAVRGHALVWPSATGPTPTPWPRTPGGSVTSVSTCR